MKTNISKLSLTLAVLLAIHIPLFIRAQETVSADELFQQARKEAFSNQNYSQAIELCKTALSKSPDYSDIRIFLGRVYTWKHVPDSARMQFDVVLKKNPDNEDASVAWTDLETWNDHDTAALALCESGLNFNPASKPLLSRKAKLLISLHRYPEAHAIVDSLLLKDPKDAETRALADRIKDNASKNKIGISYDYVYFDKQFNDPWHLLSLSYSRQTNFGTLTGRINYANRFRSNGLQFEADAYPRISKVFYTYLNLGYSNDVGVFPKYRAGFSLYANLPRSFEADAGFRYLYFSSNTWIYTASVGKYINNFWFNFRTYLVPGNSNISQSYTLTARYYLGGMYDYLTLGVGTGISADDQVNNVQLNSPYRFQSRKITAGFSRTIKKFNIIFANVTGINQEYLPKTHGMQLDFGIGYQRRF